MQFLRMRGSLNLHTFLLLFSSVAVNSLASSLPKLHYFDAKGAAELSRVLFKIGGMPFEDCRFPITAKEGGGFETTEFTAAKDAGALVANMDRVPVLEIDGVKFGQSRSIERFVADKCGLMGRGELQRLQIDCIVEHVRDIKDKWGKIRFIGGFGPNEEKKKAMDKWFAGGELSDWLVKLEKSLPSSSSDCYAVGDQLSYADVAIWQLLRDYFDDTAAATAAEKKAHCPRLSKIAAKVADVKALHQWLKERPATTF